MFGQIPDFTNGFDFMRRLWGSGSGMPAGLMPGLQAMTPPMDLDDLDKRIADLKAVESWLQLNTNLLRTTIQGLEVQRATLVALQTFGNALSPDAMQSAMENVARPTRPVPRRRSAPPARMAAAVRNLSRLPPSSRRLRQATPIPPCPPTPRCGGTCCNSSSTRSPAAPPRPASPRSAWAASAPRPAPKPQRKRLRQSRRRPRLARPPPPARASLPPGRRL
jgi:hypothetical protein